MIAFASPGAQYRVNKVAIDAAVLRVLDGGSYILGDEVAAFECSFAAYCQCSHGIGVGNGTDALILALRALGIGPGAEVITVSHTAVATVAAVLAVGAVPVLVDVDPTFYTLDAAAVVAAITKHTKAIIAVHLYGQPAPLEDLKTTARRNGLLLIEDCAQAAGGLYNNGRLGSFGDVGCFSFYPTKNLGAIGDGGMVVTHDAEVAKKIRSLRQYGWDDRRQASDTGVNSRLDEIQAAILNVKLASLDSDNARRAALAARYSEGLAGLPIVVPAARPGGHHVFHLYVITCDDREALKSQLASLDIGTGIHYATPVHREAGYATKVRIPAAGLSITEKLASRILSLPLYPELSESDVDVVIAAIRAHYRY